MQMIVPFVVFGVDLSEIWFSAGVWGTVSDWAMVVVAGVTGVLIWGTLKSQMKVQKTQDKLLKEEQARTKRLLQPIINADEADKGFWKKIPVEVKDTTIKGVFNIRLSSRVNFVRNIVVENSFDRLGEEETKFYSHCDYKMESKNYPALENQLYRFNVEINNLAFFSKLGDPLRKHYYRHFWFYYEDQVGNKFRLLIEVRISGESIKTNRNPNGYRADKLSIIDVQEL